MNELAMQLGDIVQSTTESLLSCIAEPCEPPDQTLTEVISEVSIDGGWSGRVVVGCDREVARAFAAVMFGFAPEDVTETEIRDTLAELVNIVGGNFKSLIGATGRCSLSLPYAVEAPVGPYLFDGWYAVSGGWIHVRISQHALS